VRASEIITEGLSAIVYHYTSVASALKILQTGQFGLTATTGSHEHEHAPKGYNFYLSTTRSRWGGYHTNVKPSEGVLFVLDGTWYNRHYRAGPIDYWGDRDPKYSRDRRHEAEDRIFSKEPHISIGGVKEIHVLFTAEGYDASKPRVRQLLLLAKNQDKPVYFYDSFQAWVTQDKTKQAQISMLKRDTVEKPKGPWLSSRRHKGFMLPWMQIIFGKNNSDLSYDARKIVKDLQYDYYLDREMRQLANDFANSRRPNSSIPKDRENAVKILQYMQKNKLATLKDLGIHLRDKWKNIIDQS
jgi:hypothetical protein